MELRRVERIDAETATPISFADLKTGDKFKLYDPGNEPIEKGDVVYTATSDASPCEPQGNYGIEIA